MRERITNKLTSALNPEHLEVIDDSHRHAGHLGALEGGETHFKVIIRADALSGLPKVTAHRKIYEILNAEIKERVHALAIIIK